MSVISQGDSQTFTLPAGEALTVTAAALSSGRIAAFAQRLGDTAGLTSVAASTAETFGPFATIKRFHVEALTGTLTVTTARVDFPTASEAAATALAAAAAAAALAHVPVSGTVGDVRDVIGEGVPDATARGTLTVNPTGDDNSLTFTSVAYGEGANDITIEYVDPEENDAELSVVVTGNAIVVNLATGEAGAITSTAAEVLAAIEASVPADALVTVAIHAADSGAEDDGSGIVTAMAEAPLASGAGVGIGVAGKGSRYTDITNGTLYLNTGTKAVPVWTQLAPVS